MNEIKVRKKLTHVKLKDGRVLVSESSPASIGEYLKDNHHIMIEGELHSRFDIVSAIEEDLDDLEGFILSQNKEIQIKIREKKEWLKKELGKEMTVPYAENYVKKLLTANAI